MNTAKLRQAEGKKPLCRSGFDNKKNAGRTRHFSLLCLFYSPGQYCTTLYDEGSVTSVESRYLLNAVIFKRV